MKFKAIKKSEITEELKKINWKIRDIQNSLYWYLEIPQNTLIEKYLQERYADLNKCPEKDCIKCEIIRSELALMETRLINIKKLDLSEKAKEQGK